MSREITEAHFLHDKRGLSMVLRPPVEGPTALVFVPGREILLAATRDGELYTIDPVLGTRRIASGLGEVGALAARDDRGAALVVSRDQRWWEITLDGKVRHQGEHPFFAGLDAFYVGEVAAFVGEGAEGRALWLVKEGQVCGRVRLPEAVAATGSVDSGQILLARSGVTGLSVLTLAKGVRFPKEELTGHRLRLSGRYILGFTPNGLAVWTHRGGSPETIRLPELSAGAISADGQYLGLGTRSGAVALARFDQKDRRVNPDLVRAFTQPVIAAAFASRGRWLATAAESVILWSWEGD
jgi:hypothetical protein